jgi:hypothetical protein
VKKIITIAIAAATAVAALSACTPEEGSSAATQANDEVVTSTEAETEAPAVKAKAPTKPKFTVAQEQAIQSAESYVSMSGFSKAGLIQQLSSEAGEAFKLADAKFAVKHIKVDWNEEAVQSAQSYLEMGGFSRASLIQQLSSKAGEDFTIAQATYAVDKVGL